jgi:arylformamidase
MRNSWYEQQYYPSASIANASEIIPAWEKRSANTRRQHAFIADIKYGTHRRETIDLFRVPDAKATVIYIHGGYWEMLSKIETSFVADGFLGQGISVALINYPLCPEVRIGDIRKSVLKAFAHLYLNALTPDERENIVVTGHSAGGYLAAAHLAHEWATDNLPPNPIVGVIALSGIYDVAPLMHTGMNATLKIDEQQAAALNLVTAPIRTKAQLALAVGGDEPSEFHRQTTDLAKAWHMLSPQIIALPGANHFTLVDSLASPEGELNAIAKTMLANRP